MKMATVNEFRAELATMMSSSEPVMVTRHGKVTGFFFPWQKEDEVPLALKRNALGEYRKELDGVFRDIEIDEQEMIADFKKFRKTHRRRR